MPSTTSKAQSKRSQKQKTKKRSATKKAIKMCLSLDEDIENVESDQLYKVIDESYVSKLLGFLRGEQRVVCTHADFTKVYQLIIHNTDNEDRSDDVY